MALLLVQYKMPKITRMLLCCQNQQYRGTGRCYGLRNGASLFALSTSIMVLDCLKNKEERISTKWRFSHFHGSYLKQPNGSYK